MYAIVDVGSNTVRMNIYTMEYGQPKFVLTKKEAVGLASYVKNGYMTPAGVDKVAQVLREFHNLAKDLHIENFYVFATAALRNCKNSKAAVFEAEERAQVKIDVISGAMEAELDFIGAVHALDVTDGLLIDIGGGSTELVHYRNQKIENAISLPMGSLNTYDRFVSNLLPTRLERKAIKKAVLDELKKSPEMAKGTYEAIVGIGGSARAANELNNYLFTMPLGHTSIKAPNLKKMIKLLENDEGSSLPVETLDILIRVVPERVRTLLPGMIILQTLVKHFKAQTVEVTKAGARDGYLHKVVLPQVTAKDYDGEDEPDENGHARR